MEKTFQLEWQLQSNVDENCQVLDERRLDTKQGGRGFTNGRPIETSVRVACNKLNRCTEK